MMENFSFLTLRVWIAIGSLAFCEAVESGKNPKSPLKSSQSSSTPEHHGQHATGEASADSVQDEEVLAEKNEAADTAKVARPVSSDPVQVFGWQEKIKIVGMADAMVAKLDTGATTSSLHAENQQIFERDGKKWVRFAVTDPHKVDAKRYDMEAPLIRTVMIKEPGGDSLRRNVVRLTFQIGERTVKAEFSLNNRNNMNCPVLIGRSTIQVLGWVDPSRTYLADDKIMR
jgi:hypothetical protein